MNKILFFIILLGCAIGVNAQAAEAYDPTTPVSLTMLMPDENGDTVQVDIIDGSMWGQLGSVGLSFPEGDGILESWTIQFSIKGITNPSDSMFFGTQVSSWGMGLMITKADEDGICGVAISTGDMTGPNAHRSEVIGGLKSTELVTLTMSYDADTHIASVFTDKSQQVETLNFTDLTIPDGNGNIIPFVTTLTSCSEWYDVMTGEGAYMTATGASAVVETNMHSAPEPTTGTLSLLALAGLCARRRK